MVQHGAQQRCWLGPEAAACHSAVPVWVRAGCCRAGERWRAYTPTCHGLTPEPALCLTQGVFVLCLVVWMHDMHYWFSIHILILLAEARLRKTCCFHLCLQNDTHLPNTVGKSHVLVKLNAWYLGGEEKRFAEWEIESVRLIHFSLSGWVWSSSSHESTWNPSKSSRDSWRKTVSNF